MRLLHISEDFSLSLEEFEFGDVPRYAILSHRWQTGEVLFKDFEQGSEASKEGYEKIKGFARKAQRHGFEYCWVDTCCIDKRSSAELSESINSMYKWYHDAGECYAYLSDVPQLHWSKSIWWSRGWTLQELLAPQHVIFYDCEWNKIGTKSQLRRDIAQNTGIMEAALRGFAPSMFSIQHRMLWASRRITSRTEDIAYCLLGIFNVNMPLLYGEGSRAFTRLQEEILRQELHDTSLFAWYTTGSESYLYHGLLASSPAQFQWEINMKSVSYADEPPSLNGNGIRIKVHLRPYPRYGNVNRVYLAILSCGRRSEEHDTADEYYMAVLLLRCPKSYVHLPPAITENDTFVRIDTGTLNRVRRTKIANCKQHIIHVRDVMTTSCLSHIPDATMPIFLDHNGIELVEVLGAQDCIRASDTSRQALFARPCKGKVIGLYMNSKVRKSSPFLIIIGLDWAGLPWCWLSNPRSIEEAREAYASLNPGREKGSAIYEDSSKRVKTDISYINNRVNLCVTVDSMDILR
ncbi:HET-domain-containing protein [Viridothelium virens]|uniref:HET-domain-containing protein n=1 Tax=Viridothelium virens TaxID=1048519 RepID=A0A6A6GW65_VIRVR|nr:HET-domain-containing protein [Viridothelium virens]